MGMGKALSMAATNPVVQKKAAEYLTKAAEDPKFRQQLGSYALQGGGLIMGQLKEEQAQMLIDDVSKKAGSALWSAAQKEENQKMAKEAMFAAWLELQKEETQKKVAESAQSIGNLAWKQMQDEENQRRAKETATQIGSFAWKQMQDEDNQRKAADVAQQAGNYTMKQLQDE